MIHKKILIKGHVQGVGFRYAARSIARQLGIKGFVRNLPDGSVYVEAEGSEKQIQDFINWCHIGPPRAHINSVVTENGEIKGYSDFDILPH
jgi:acylphosphatase